jgi:DNA-binding NtrC family response regulator
MRFAPCQGGRHTSKWIAIIDEDESMQDSLRKLIESAGLVARCFGSAEEFLEYDLHCEVGCLIAEIQMRGVSGLELQARLKEEQGNIPIIFYYKQWGRQDADSSDERRRSRVPGDTVGLSAIAQNGPCCT